MLQPLASTVVSPTDLDAITYLVLQHKYSYAPEPFSGATENAKA